MTEIKTIMVIGSGLMGSGIAQVAARAGFQVIMNNKKRESLAKGYNRIVENLNSQITKKRMTQTESGEILARISKSTDLADAGEADFIIETVIENAEVKKTIFKKLDEICRKDVIFASNTSSIPIASLASATMRPELFIGMHFFSPVTIMKLVEVIPSPKTIESTIETAESIAMRMQKETVRIKDVPGFLVNRINAAFRAEVFKCLLEGVASIEDIDKAVRLGLNHPLGPFELSDSTGLEIGYHVFETLFEGYNDPKFRPSILLEKLVTSGELGRKTGKGWYDYSSGEKKPRTDIP